MTNDGMLVSAEISPAKSLLAAQERITDRRRERERERVSIGVCAFN